MTISNDDPRALNEKISDAFHARELETFADLLRRHPEFRCNEDGSDRWLSWAAGAGDVEMLELLVSLGLDVNNTSSRQAESETSFYDPTGCISHACWKGQIEAVRWLLAHGAQINVPWRGRRRCEPLRSAAIGGHMEVVRLLVQHGADIFATEASDENVLTDACDYGQREVCQYLRSLGLKPDWETTPPDYPSARQRCIRRLSAGGSDLKHLESIAGNPAVDVYSCEFSDESYYSIFEGAPRRLLFSAGLSDISQPGTYYSLYCEIVLVLPREWRLDEAALADPRWGWPVEMFKQLIRELQSRDEWGLAPCVIRLPRFPAPRESGTEFSAVALLRTVPITMIAPDHHRILAYMACPIYKEELAEAEVSGVKWLINQGISEVLDPKRPNLVGK